VTNATPEEYRGRAALVRRLGLFDATMIVMGGIVGAGIFINPYVVARLVATPGLILGAWAIGGVIALAGAFIWAELAAAEPEVGGQYAYIREAFHPLLAFLYGWALLLVTQSGGMAAVAVTFALYFRELTATSVSDTAIATGVLGGLTLVNCFGVRAGSNLQSAFMVTKILAIAALLAFGLFLAGEPRATEPWLGRPQLGLGSALGAALVPVLFAYGGWQTSSFVAGEVRNPTRNLPLGLLLGVMGVVLLYLGVNFVCLRALGPDGLAATTTPASEVMRQALGARGGKLIALGIAISTLGFLSQGMLTAPRVYFAMARDGVFFRSVGWVHPRSRVPAVAILLQGVVASVIVLSGRYEQILNYVVSVDWIFFGLTAAALFVFRRRGRANREHGSRFRMPGHPLTTAAFVATCAAVVVNTVYRYPENAGIGVLILLAGIPVYTFWSSRGRSA
jgi:APA family basic amino acid/polyamine antiporter